MRNPIFFVTLKPNRATSKKTTHRTSICARHLETAHLALRKAPGFISMTYLSIPIDAIDTYASEFTQGEKVGFRRTPKVWAHLKHAVWIPYGPMWPVRRNVSGGIASITFNIAIPNIREAAQRPSLGR